MTRLRTELSLHSWSLPVAAAAGCAALALRPVDYFSMITTGLVGAAGLVPKEVSERRVAGRMLWLAVVAFGISVFGIGRDLGPQVGVRLTGLGIASILIAAVAEEIFFRRFLYDRVARFGPVVAISVTALAFAIIHVPMYGSAVLPIDLAAGMFLGWQRYATGDWTASAVTHMIANLMQMG